VFVLCLISNLCLPCVISSLLFIPAIILPVNAMSNDRVIVKAVRVQISTRYSIEAGLTRRFDH